MTFHVVTHRSWLALLFAEHGGVQDFGLDIDPGTAPGDVWWAPGEWVARAAASGVRLPVLSCGQRWMDRQHPDHWLRRKTTVIPVRAVPSLFDRWTTDTLHIKLPEVKTDDFPASVLDRRGLSAWATGLAPHQPVQVSEPVTLTVEARFFVAHREVRAESAYRAGNVWWSDDTFPDVRDDRDVRAALHDMRSLAREVAAVADAPPGYAVDIGILGGEQAGAPVVIEANAAWSSNPYDADIGGVVESVRAAHDFSGEHTRWLFDTGQFPGPVHPLRVRRASSIAPAHIS